MLDFASPYHTLLVWPCYAKFMAILHYGCLKLKMPDQQGVIVVSPSTTDVYLCEQEGATLAVADVTTTNSARIQRQPGEEPLTAQRGTQRRPSARPTTPIWSRSILKT